MVYRKSSVAALVAVAIISAADALQTDAWNILTQAVNTRGPDEASALGMLGAIGSTESRALIERILKGADIAAISLLASGLTPDQCAVYLPELARAARDPGGDTKLRILDAISRAGSRDAAGVLAETADSGEQPAAGVAFGLLRQMGDVAQPFITKTVTSGGSPWSRETAAWTLVEMDGAGASAAFRSALHDADDRVRAAAAVGLARLGGPDGEPELQAASRKSGSDYQIEALVGLALLGRTEAMEALKAFATGPDEAVRGRAVWAIARSGSRELKDMAYSLGLDREPVLRSMLAERLLDPADPRDMSVLQEMIASGNDVSQVIAARRLLGTKATGPAEQAIARAMWSENQAARALAVKTASGSAALRRDLAKHLSSRDPEVQVAALSAIADLHQRERLTEVAPYLASKTSAVSAAAARTLVALDPIAAKPVLEAGLASESGYVRIHSAAMLLAAAVRSHPK